MPVRKESFRCLLSSNVDVSVSCVDLPTSRTPNVRSVSHAKKSEGEERGKRAEDLPHEQSRTEEVCTNFERQK